MGFEFYWALSLAGEGHTQSPFSAQALAVDVRGWSMAVWRAVSLSGTATSEALGSRCRRME